MQKHRRVRLQQKLHYTYELLVERTEDAKHNLQPFTNTLIVQGHDKQIPVERTAEEGWDRCGGSERNVTEMKAGRRTGGYCSQKSNGHLICEQR
jgi:vacuolar-type H+-ATPase subunit B/Vma2